MDIGKKTWVFADGDLPPHGDSEPFGHEAMMVVNTGKVEAFIELQILFEDRAPVSGIHISVAPERVHCFRMDYPVGDEQFQIPFGQYAVILNSSVPVVCLYGRLDRRPDMAYYTVGGYSV
jgi:hypothetical protein